MYAISLGDVVHTCEVRVLRGAATRRITESSPDFARLRFAIIPSEITGHAFPRTRVEVPVGPRAPKRLLPWFTKTAIFAPILRSSFP